MLIEYSKFRRKNKCQVCFYRKDLNWEPRKKVLLGLITVNLFIYILLIALSAYSVADFSRKWTLYWTDWNLAVYFHRISLRRIPFINGLRLMKPDFNFICLVKESIFIRMFKGFRPNGSVITVCPYVKGES